MVAAPDHHHAGLGSCLPGPAYVVGGFDARGHMVAVTVQDHQPYVTEMAGGVHGRTPGRQRQHAAYEWVGRGSQGRPGSHRVPDENRGDRSRQPPQFVERPHGVVSGVTGVPAPVPVTDLPEQGVRG